MEMEGWSKMSSKLAPSSSSCSEERVKQELCVCGERERGIRNRKVVCEIKVE